MTKERTTETTMADVARLAEVSVSSVSNVINNRSKKMRPETRERILNAISQLGYTPNLAARQLKTGHSKIIGLIVPSVANPFFGNFARLVEEAALEHGYQVLFGNSGRYQDREKSYAEQLWGAGVRGMIVATSLSKLSHLKDLVARGMHVVAFDRPPTPNDQFPTDSICVDNLLTMRMLIKHLVALDHERIGFITGPIRTNSRKSRFEGYQKCLIEMGLNVDKNLIWEGKARNFGDVGAIELGRQGAHYFFSKPNPPTALIAVNDMYAFGVYAGARDLGIRIPEDVSLAGIDNLTLSEVVEPPLTTVEQPVAEMARIAVEKLLDRIQHKSTTPQEHQKLTPKLIVRSSTGPCKT